MERASRRRFRRPRRLRFCQLWKVSTDFLVWDSITLSLDLVPLWFDIFDTHTQMFDHFCHMTWFWSIFGKQQGSRTLGTSGGLETKMVCSNEIQRLFWAPIIFPVCPQLYSCCKLEPCVDYVPLTDHRWRTLLGCIVFLSIYSHLLNCMLIFVKSYSWGFYFVSHHSATQLTVCSTNFRCELTSLLGTCHHSGIRF